MIQLQGDAGHAFLERASVWRRCLVEGIDHGLGFLDWNDWRSGLAARKTYLARHATGRLGSLTWLRICAF